MKNTKVKLVTFLLFGWLLSTLAFAQDKKPSPAATASGKAGGANITINYSSPSVKGRKIWGELVPYGTPWRAGANKATVFETDKDVKIEGKTLPAGKYSLFAIPNEKEWEIIFNSETGQWGIDKQHNANFDPAKNVITVKVKPGKSASFNEKLTYAVSDKGFVLQWENVEVPVAIK